MRICVAQIGYIAESIEAHIQRIKDIIRYYHAADLIVFPELILHGHPSVAHPEGLLHRRVKAFYRGGSRDLDLYRFVRQMNARVVIGDLRQRGDRFYNLAIYVDGEGMQSYVKTHVHWTENFVPGKDINVFDTPLGRIGASICFDAAFPEVMRVQALQGARILVNIAAVPAHFPPKYMWRRFQAHALNNQAFMIYCNRPGEKFSGYSAVFDPKGDVVASAEEGEEIFEAEIDLSEVDAWREQEQIYANLRPFLYRRITRAPEPRRPNLHTLQAEAFRREVQLTGVPEADALPPADHADNARKFLPAPTSPESSRTLTSAGEAEGDGR